jgi:hypothetical protein
MVQGGMKYTDVAAPRFANAEQTQIDCLVVFPSLGPAPTPYTAAELDPGAEHSEEIFKRCLAGEFGPVAPFEEVQPVAAPKREPLPTKPAAPKRTRRAAKPPTKPPKRLVLLNRTRRAAKPAATKPPKRKR